MSPEHTVGRTLAGKGGQGESGTPRALVCHWLLAVLGKDCCVEPSPLTPQALAEPSEVACGEEVGTCATGEMSSIHGGVSNMFALESAIQPHRATEVLSHRI